MCEDICAEVSHPTRGGGGGEGWRRGGGVEAGEGDGGGEAEGEGRGGGDHNNHLAGSS
jgi:hypothetical protein